MQRAEKVKERRERSLINHTMPGSWPWTSVKEIIVSMDYKAQDVATEEEEKKEDVEEKVDAEEDEDEE